MKIPSMLTQSAQQLFANIDVNKRVQGESLQNSGLDLPDLNGLSDAAGKGVKFVLEQGIQLSDDEVAQIAEFMDGNSGTVAEKLSALSVALQKKLPLSQVVMGDIHTARSATLADFLVDPPQRSKTESGTPNQWIDGAAKAAQRTVAERLDQLVSQLFESALDSEQVEVHPKDRQRANGETIIDAKSTVSDRPVLGDRPAQSDGVIPLSSDQLDLNDKVKYRDEVQLDAESDNHRGAIVSQKRAVDNERRVQSVETEVLPKQFIGQAGAADDAFVDDLANQLQQLLAEVPLTDDYNVADVQGGTEIQKVQPYRLLLEETVTPKLLAVKQSFDDLKQNALSQLAQIEDVSNKMTTTQRAESVVKLIDKLDGAIMKSDIGMYVSMKVERDMLKQSSELRNARNLLAVGKVEQAEEIVRSVVREIEKMQFKPTLKRVLALGNPIALSDEELKYNDIVKWARNGIDSFSKAEKSVAGLVHYLRKLGVNHEVETFQQTYASPEKGKSPIEKNLINLKRLLLTMAKDEQDGVNQGKSSKLLSHINGQQLQLKVVDRVQEQQLMLSLPMHLNGRISDVKVYIKAQHKDLKIDWQNFNMFFVLDTKRFDDVGVKVVAVDKKVRIDVYNDDIERKSAIMALASQLKDYVESVGYNVAGLHFAAWRGQHPNRLAERKPQVQSKPPTGQFGKGQVDFKI